MDANYQIQFSLTRYEHYLAGRHLFFFAHTRAARIMLGYAAECQLKMALLLKGGRNHKLLYGHDIAALHREAAAVGAIYGVAVSDDFLRLVNDGLNQRYPSQFLQTVEQATADGLVVGSSPADILPYDDYILQLDDCIVRLSTEPLASIGVRGALSVDCTSAGAFFHSNAAAYSRWPTYLSIVRAFRPDSRDIIARLERGPQAFWRAPAFPISLAGDPAELASAAPAANYVYPRLTVVTDTDGKQLLAGEIALGTPIRIGPAPDSKG